MTNGKKFKRPSVMMTVLFIVLGLYVLSLFIPFLWALMTSFKSRLEFGMSHNVIGLPMKWQFENYVKAWDFFVVRISIEGGTTREVYLAEMFLNSILYSVGMAFVGTLSPCIMAYLCAKYPYRFGRFIYSLVVVLMLIPIVGNMPSMIVVLKTLGIFDTYFGMLCMKAGFINTYFIIFYSTFKGISGGYAEAARIDGASDARVMFQIMFPLAKTTIGAIYLLLLVSMWNDYMTPMMYYPSHPTAALGLMLYSQNNLVNSVPEQLVGSVIVITPILIVFLCFKKYLMGNLTMGGLKG